MAKFQSHHTTTPPAISPTISKPCYPPQPPNNNNSSSFNLMVILAAIVCAFLCALGLNTMLLCVLQCASRVLMEPLQWIASRRINSGLKKKEMVALPTSVYDSKSHNNSTSGDSGSSPSSDSSNCAICLNDFCDGDKIRFLPKCNHGFHVACIDKWLLSHSSCPTCRSFLKSNASASAHPFHILIA
ncbi:hypothetical protein PIB30_046033 [Stylosanthes scabra]|uniref:RING-type E3 ubiquitin transferase n=1 Tax=Stylosanthes scabra TaxID=79078 RepID=A0ABU6ZF44_9FABA|nr:hypothetical protein [Stylosanthes scabra]